MIAVHFERVHVFARKDINADFIGIVDDIPELLYETVGIRKIDRMQRSVFMLFDSEQDQPAKRIGKGRIGLPDALGKSPQGFLCLKAVVLSVLRSIILCLYAFTLVINARMYSLR